MRSTPRYTRRDLLAEPQHGCDIFIVNGRSYDDGDSAWQAHMAEGGTFQSSKSEKAELAHREWCKWHDAYSNAQTNIYKGLCGEMGIPWNDGWGSACHCTCGKEERATAWFSENKHDTRCPIVLPNFWFKPTDLRVEWYKYIGREMETNRPLELSELVAIYEQCLASLK